MITTLDTETERDRMHDRRRQIRDRLLCALEDAGRAMSPRELARVTGLGVATVTLCAQNWNQGRSRYFEVEDNGKHVVSVDRHHHLKIGV